MFILEVFSFTAHSFPLTPKLHISYLYPGPKVPQVCIAKHHWIFRASRDYLQAGCIICGFVTLLEVFWIWVETYLAHTMKQEEELMCKKFFIVIKIKKLERKISSAKNHHNRISLDTQIRIHNSIFVYFAYGRKSKFLHSHFGKKNSNSVVSISTNCFRGGSYRSHIARDHLFSHFKYTSLIWSAWLKTLDLLIIFNFNDETLLLIGKISQLKTGLSCTNSNLCARYCIICNACKNLLCQFNH